MEDLKKQKRINKIQLTKLCSRLVRLMAEESVNIDAILTTLENTEEKMLDVIQLLEDLVVIHEKNGGTKCQKKLLKNERLNTFNLLTHLRTLHSRSRTNTAKKSYTSKKLYHLMQIR